MTPPAQPRHLPATRAELRALGIDALDVILVTGDAHVDHPSFPASLLGRHLWAHGFRVGVLSRPDPGDPESVALLGAPRLFFGVTAGSLDSMVANTTALKKRRSDDPFAPDGRAGGRPDRAVTVYANLLRRRFGKSVLLVAGGLEASLRRFAHYDFWSDSVRRSLLYDAGVDLIVHGMGEGPIRALAERMRAFRREGGEWPGGGEGLASSFPSIRGLCWRQPLGAPLPEGTLLLPEAEAVQSDPRAQASAAHLIETRRDATLSQSCAGLRVLSTPPWPPLSGGELDAIHALPFSRDPHPMYGGAAIPALTQVRFSVTSHRGCFGGCAFCAIGAMEGKAIQSRSPESVLSELRDITRHPEFRGTVNDLGGPTANMYGMACGRSSPCARVSCLWPQRCPDLRAESAAYRRLLAQAREIPGIRHLFVTTGIRMDLANGEEALVRALAFHHTSGRLKVAPEHTEGETLAAMRKPEEGGFEPFLKLHRRLSKEAGKRQEVVPYVMAAHPGCTLQQMARLAVKLKGLNVRAEQCQIFTPTPGTAATAMYATGLVPATLAPLFVERDPAMKELHKALILHHLPESAPKIRRALTLLGNPEWARGLGVSGPSRRERR